MIVKILIGGSPCTKWSIAQKNNRETAASGIGWELFKNFLIAKEKFKPDYFLYENNKSASQPIKDQIALELGVGKDPNVRFTYINSSLVSAQNRQRFYVTNFGDISQPEDRNIELLDILESTTAEPCYELSEEYYKGTDTLVGMVENNGSYRNGDQPSQQYRVYGSDNKSVTLNTGGQATQGHYLVPNPINTCNGKKSRTLVASYFKKGMANFVSNEGHDSTGVAEQVVGRKANADGSYDRTYELRKDKKAHCLTSVTARNMVAEERESSNNPTYHVENGLITIKGKQYPIKLKDGSYVIRKLTVKECCRLQTLPDDYCKAVSNSQAYKGLGNGWTAEVIIHLLNHIGLDKDTEIHVLSMYDGIGTGRYVLDKMGFKNIKYKAYEIDKYAMQVSSDNYQDIEYCGDAFQVRNDDWEY